VGLGSASGKNSPVQIERERAELPLGLRPKRLQQQLLALLTLLLQLLPRIQEQNRIRQLQQQLRQLT